MRKPFYVDENGKVLKYVKIVLKKQWKMPLTKTATLNILIILKAYRVFSSFCLNIRIDIRTDSCF